MTADDKFRVRIMRLPHAADLPLPAYQSAHAAGLDLVAAVPADVTKAPIVHADIREVAALDETTRGVRGFGSTGAGNEAPSAS